jgi:hypothetical protein
VVGGSNRKWLTTMLENLTNPSERFLDPMERVSEVLFGLIMVLTFTCSFSVAGAGREDVRSMLIGALGCNLAWGIIDAVFYLMGSFSTQGQKILQLKAVRSFSDPSAAHRVIAGALPPLVASILSPAELETMRQRLNLLPEPPVSPRLSRNDWLGALGVFLIVFLSTFPVVLPFIFIRDPRSALRTSNAIAVVLLFLTGYRFGHHAGHRPWRMGFAMVILGSAMVGITIFLGG